MHSKPVPSLMQLQVHVAVAPNQDGQHVDVLAVAAAPAAGDASGADGILPLACPSCCYCYLLLLLPAAATGPAPVDVAVVWPPHPRNRHCSSRRVHLRQCMARKRKCSICVARNGCNGGAVWIMQPPSGILGRPWACLGQDARLPRPVGHDAPHNQVANGDSNPNGLIVVACVVSASRQEGRIRSSPAG